MADNEFHIFRVETGETEWVAAPSKEAALAFLARETYGSESVEEFIADEDPVVTQLGDDESLTVIDTDADARTTRTKTCREWAQERDEPWIVATTCF